MGLSEGPGLEKIRGYLLQLLTALYTQFSPSSLAFTEFPHENFPESGRTRDCLVPVNGDRNDRWRNAFVSGGCFRLSGRSNLEGTMTRYENEIDAEIHFCNTILKIVLRRSTDPTVPLSFSNHCCVSTTHEASLAITRYVVGSVSMDGMVYLGGGIFWQKKKLEDAPSCPSSRQRFSKRSQLNLHSVAKVLGRFAKFRHLLD